MIEIDVMTGYATCGGASLLSAVAVQLARIDEPSLKSALRTWAMGFVVLALGLFPLLFLQVTPNVTWPLLLAIEGTTLGAIFFALGFRQLNGQVSNKRAWLYVFFGDIVAMAAAYSMGLFWTSVAVCVMSMLIGTSILYDQRRFIQQPANMAERALGLYFIVFTLSWAVRLVLAIPYANTPDLHLMNMPEPMRSIYAFFYGGLPLLLALLLLSVVNSRLYAQVHSRALTDDLTGLFTRRALRELAPSLLTQARKECRQMAVLMLDLDHFKAVNDRYGHGGGDSVLRHTAKLLKERLRTGEMLIRFGGEEFLLIIPVEGAQTTSLVGQRLCEAIAASPCVSESVSIPITVSIGAAMIQEGQPLDHALMRADAALYRAKDKGRNRVEIDDDRLQFITV